MTNGRRGLLLLGTAALAFGLAMPTRLADSRFKNLKSVFGDLTDTFRETFHMAPPTSQERKAAQATPESGGETDPGQLLNKPDAFRDGTALKNAYTAAMADQRIRALGIDPTGFLEAIAAYRLDNLDTGDAFAAKSNSPIARVALEWVALREVPQKIGLGRLKAFATAHPDWPANAFLRRQMEARMLRGQDPIAVERFFTDAAPETPLGKLALARALKATGRTADATKLARAVFRESDLGGFADGLLRTEFGADLTKGDYKYRADRLLYKEKFAPALHFASQAGPDVLALAKARVTLISDGGNDKVLASVPEALRNDPGLLLAEAQKLRRSDKLVEAAQLIQSVPKVAAQLVDSDEWWIERRVLARRLLDDGKPQTAYEICADATGGSRETRVEAEFHAGWIALRFLNDANRAAAHFERAAAQAETATSIARIAYWQGRTAENSADPVLLSKAKGFYARAAAHGSTYYGQLARNVLGMTTTPVQEPAHVAAGDDRAEAVRAVELLYAAGEKEAAYALATFAANELDDPHQVGALAAVIARQQDAHLALTIGKLVGQRGIPVDPLAFPTFGIPAFDALQNSAPLPVVYSIARQESAFIPGAVSKAGAKGLMQMIDSTARHTATKAGLPFDPNRMLSDASFNAQLGAAHLGELIAEQGGSLILTFAAYNAGPGRVKQWIDAYGDPRTPGVDPVDWVERIPFTETRNYVQRVMANVTMYTAIFDGRKGDPRLAGREAKL